MYLYNSEDTIAGKLSKTLNTLSHCILYYVTTQYYNIIVPMMVFVQLNKTNIFSVYKCENYDENQPYSE